MVTRDKGAHVRHRTRRGVRRNGCEQWPRSWVDAAQRALRGERASWLLSRQGRWDPPQGARRSGLLRLGSQASPVHVPENKLPAGRRLENRDPSTSAWGLRYQRPSMKRAPRPAFSTPSSIVVARYPRVNDRPARRGGHRRGPRAESAPISQSGQAYWAARYPLYANSVPRFRPSAAPVPGEEASAKHALDVAQDTA